MQLKLAIIRNRTTRRDAINQRERIIGGLSQPLIPMQTTSAIRTELNIKAESEPIMYTEVLLYSIVLILIVEVDSRASLFAPSRNSVSATT